MTNMMPYQILASSMHGKKIYIFIYIYIYIIYIKVIQKQWI